VFRPAITTATPIQFTWTGMMDNGTLNGTDFPSSNFTITAIGDTSSRIHYGSPTPNSYSIDNTSSTVTIDGIGTLQVLSATKTFVNNSAGGKVVGYSRPGTAGADLFDGPKDTAFLSWDMLSSIGPISGTGTVLQWDVFTSPLYGLINTNAGI